MPQRTAALVFTLGALGDTAVGALVFAFPQVLAVLMAAPLDTAGLTVARMLGAAVLALGVTWWIARGEPTQLPRHAAGFLIYNIGIGIVFGMAALTATQSLLPWIVCVGHLALGAVFGAALAATPRNESPRGAKK
jgi:hypothetical protein